MFNKQDKRKNGYMLNGSLAKKGYGRWRYSFIGKSEKTGEEKPFFIEYFICNPSSGDTYPIFGQLKENKEKKARPSYLMIKAGCYGKNACQINRFFGIRSVSIHGRSPFSVSASDCILSERELRGSVRVTREEAAEHPEHMSDAGFMEWELTINKRVAFNMGFCTGRLICALKAFEMNWHADGMRTLYAGNITLNGERFTVTREGSFGYTDNIWGRGFSNPWIWLSSCCMTSRLSGRMLHHSVFDICGGKPKFFFLPLGRKLNGALFYEGTEFEFNFFKLLKHTKTEFEAYEKDSEIVWHIRQENRKAVMLTDVTCQKRDMLLLNYESPYGEKRHTRLWNGGTGKGRIQLFRKGKSGPMLIDDISAENVGCTYGEYDKE